MAFDSRGWNFSSWVSVTQHRVLWQSLSSSSQMLVGDRGGIGVSGWIGVDRGCRWQTPILETSDLVQFQQRILFHVPPVQTTFKCWSQGCSFVFCWVFNRFWDGVSMWVEWTEKVELGVSTTSCLFRSEVERSFETPKRLSLSPATIFMRIITDC